MPSIRIVAFAAFTFVAASLVFSAPVVYETQSVGQASSAHELKTRDIDLEPKGYRRLKARQVVVVPLWGQCGGIGYCGPTTCAPGGNCTVQNEFFSQCLPPGIVI